MENKQAVALPAPFENESDEEYGYRGCQEIGAFNFFSIARDYYVKLANDLQAVAASRPLTDEEKVAARNVRNDIIQQQACVDAAYVFEQIADSEGRAVN